jgi:hypothetical protein
MPSRRTGPELFEQSPRTADHHSDQRQEQQHPRVDIVRLHYDTPPIDVTPSHLAMTGWTSQRDHDSIPTSTRAGIIWDQLLGRGRAAVGRSRNTRQATTAPANRRRDAFRPTARTIRQTNGLLARQDRYRFRGIRAADRTMSRSPISLGMLVARRAQQHELDPSPWSSGRDQGRQGVEDNLRHRVGRSVSAVDLDQLDQAWCSVSVVG